MLTREDLKRGGKNFSWLLAGNYASQLLSLVTVVLIARRLGPQQYGILNAAVAFVGLFAIAKLQGFDRVLVREAAAHPEAESELYGRMLGLKLIASTAGLLVCGVAVFVVNLSTPERIAVLLFASTLVTQSVASLVSCMFQAHEDMRWVTFTNLVRQSSYILIAAAGLYTFVPSSSYALWAMCILTASYWVALIVSIVWVSRYVRSPWRPRMPQVDVPLYKAGIVFSLATVVVYMYTKIDLLMARAFLDATAVGLYSVALNTTDRVLSPVALMITALFPAMVKRTHERGGADLRFIERSVLVFGGIGLLVALVGTFGGKWALQLVFGSQYAGAGAPFVLLLWALVPAIALMPMVSALQASRQEMFILRIGLSRAVMNVAFDWLFLTLGWGIVGVAVSSIVTSVLFNTAFFILARPRIAAGLPEAPVGRMAS